MMFVIQKGFLFILVLFKTLWAAYPCQRYAAVFKGQSPGAAGRHARQGAMRLSSCFVEVMYHKNTDYSQYQERPRKTDDKD